MVINKQSEDKLPYISVIIVNWNGAKFLNKCLSSLEDQTYKNFEIIIVDNGSTDNSLEKVEINWSNIRIERLQKNIGFAAANNIGARLAKGIWIALLNNDAFPTPGWLETLVETSISYPEYSFFASCLVMVDRNNYNIDLLLTQVPQCGTIDGMGDAYNFSGMAWRKGHGKPLDILRQKKKEVFGPCAAAAFYPRDLFLQIGGFDEDFFCYHEDVDHAFRLRLQGHRCLYVPEAIVKHVGSGSHGEHSDIVRYYSHRNLIWTYFKNMPTPLIWWYLPVHLIFNFISIIYFIWRGQGRIIWKAKIDGIFGLIIILKKRRKIQRERRVKYSEIKKIMDRDWLNPYRKPILRTE